MLLLGSLWEFEISAAVVSVFMLNRQFPATLDALIAGSLSILCTVLFQIFFVA